MKTSYNPTYRRIFPSYDWDEDVWRVNQIMNLDEILEKEDIGFEKGVPNEEIKSSDRKIEEWIKSNMERCSCVIFFVGEKTYKSEWVKYEMELAKKLRKARFIINLRGMKNKEGEECKECPDPYKHHRLYSSTGGYMIKRYDWIKNNGLENISDWIEDACQRAGK